MEHDITKHMLVSKIKEGTVIDKIPPGKSILLLKILHIDENLTDTIGLAIKVSSKSMGTKDIVKLTNRFLSEEEYKKIWLIAPNAKIAIIRNYEVAEKFNLKDKELSMEFTGVLTCNNPTCATNYREPVIPSFKVLKRDPLLVRCQYCDRVMLEENIREQL